MATKKGDNPDKKLIHMNGSILIDNRVDRWIIVIQKTGRIGETTAKQLRAMLKDIEDV